jgi:hypothetical protein
MRELGLTAEEFKKIAAEVKANHAKLDACPGPHLFVLITPGALINNRYRCQTCRGEVDHQRYHWYMQGLTHGSRKPT